MKVEFLFAGFGGQGVMFAGQLLAYAAMDAGLQVTWIPSYGPEMRGGTAHCFVVLSEKPIGSPIVRNPKVVMAFNKPSFDRYEPLVAEDGLLAYNASLINQKSQRTDITALPIQATTTAEKLGDIRLANMVMLGAVLTRRPIVSLEQIQVALAAHLPAHRRSLLALNNQALEKGAAIAQSAGVIPHR